jgi:hypothetical protein
MANPATSKELKSKTKGKQTYIYPNMYNIIHKIFNNS